MDVAGDELQTLLKFMKKAVILANGIPPSRRVLNLFVKSSDLFVCADGGANAAAAMNVTPHVIIGDLDSVCDETLKKFNKSKVIRVRDQESTDLEKALAFAVAQRCGSIVLLGATGGRIDHEVGNLSAFVKYARKAKITCIDQNGTLTPLTGKFSAALPAGTTVSLLPLTSCEGITTTGLRWNLKNETLRFGLREGTSNLVETSPITILYRKGALVLFVAGKWSMVNGL
jgi:thiamine pyrophosphokinase